MSILVLKGFTKEQFRLLHPGGALGKGLSLIFDIMHREIPLVKTNDNMQNAVIEMTKYGFGCVGVIDDNENLVGIITDGDLRRKMSPDILSKPVDIIMTENPIVISKNITASELLHTMETNKITNVFVANTSGKPIGLVHIHDLVTNKVI